MERVNMCEVEFRWSRRILLTVILLLLAIAHAGCGKSTVSQEAPPSPGATGVSHPVPLTNMVLIHSGTFQRIRFPVTLTHDYWIGKYEVTQKEFLAVTGHNPSHFMGDSNRPVEKVTFLDAAAYCQKLTDQERVKGNLPAGYEYRLPTEAEWEYACRAGSTNRFSFGDDTNRAERFAWTAENSEATTHPVGLREPNAWGLYDMHGNVWEWCLDWFAPYPAAPLVDPSGSSSNKYKVFKGGGWNQDIPFGSASSRFMMSPSNASFASSSLATLASLSTTKAKATCPFNSSLTPTTATSATLE